MLLFLTAYGQYWAGPYDMDNTNVVDVNDLLRFLLRFIVRLNRNREQLLILVVR